MSAILHTPNAYSLPQRPYRSVLGPSKFMKRLPGLGAPKHAAAVARVSFWDPGFLGRLRVPLSRIHE